MFKNTMPFIPKINDKRYRLNIGVEVPKNAVNLAHFNVPPLDSSENIIIGDNSSFILENMTQTQEVVMYVDTNNQLKNVKDGILTDANIESELIQITDKFNEDVPLYYCYKLKYLHYDRGPGLDGTYYGESIILKDLHDNGLPSSYKWKAILKSVEPPEEADAATIRKYKNLYEVVLYTSFQVENNFQVKCVYNAVSVDDVDSSLNIIPNYEEIVNPQVFYSKANSIMEAITTEHKYFIQKSSTQVKSSVVYAKGTFIDPRIPQKLKLQMVVEYLPVAGTPAVLTIDIPQYLYLYNRDSAINDELEDFVGRKQKLFNQTVRQFINNAGLVPSTFYGRQIISVKLDITEVDRDREAITIYTRPDGDGYVLAETTLDTGRITDVPDKHFKSKNGYILTGYAIKFKDRNPIKLLLPRERSSLENWYIRIQNGRFTKKLEDGDKLHYFLPEYYTQHYDEDYGFPYKKVVGERPMNISTKSIKVKNSPLFITVDSKGIPDNINVYRIDAYGNKWPININNWNDKDGIINLTDYISDNDEIYVDYVFEEQSYIYRGYNKMSSKALMNHVFLDCNPNKHHLMSTFAESVLNDEMFDRPSFSLIDKVIYIYMRPAIIEHIEGNIEYNEKVLYHLLQELTDDEMRELNLVLIGSIYVRPNSSFFSLQITDTRTRGGGILEEISENLRKELEPESDYYWDIGFWDGEAYPENAVIVVRLDKKILKQFGGRFTEGEVEIAVNKHIAFGTYAIVEYVSTYTDEDFTINNLNIDVTPLNKMNYKPFAFFDVDLDNDTSILDISVYEEPPYKIGVMDLGAANTIIKPDIINITTGIDTPSLIALSEMKLENTEFVDLTAKAPLEEGIDMHLRLDVEEESFGESILSVEECGKLKPSYISLTIEGES